MKLTGKCKEEFEKWYNDPLIEKVGLRRLTQWFYTLTKSMQYGVYVDFFDSVGVFIEITNDHKDIKTFWVDINAIEINTIELNNRTEARTIAIEKANKIYNERH